MTDYVLDTEPPIAYFYDELGAPDVTERLQAIESEEPTGAISHATVPRWSTKLRVSKPVT
jgi:hypothetical protein